MEKNKVKTAFCNRDDQPHPATVSLLHLSAHFAAPWPPLQGSKAVPEEERLYLPTANGAPVAANSGQGWWFQPPLSVMGEGSRCGAAPAAS